MGNLWEVYGKTMGLPLRKYLDRKWAPKHVINNKQVKSCNNVYFKDLVTRRNLCHHPSGGRPMFGFIHVT